MIDMTGVVVEQSSSFGEVFNYIYLIVFFDIWNMQVLKMEVVQEPPMGRVVYCSFKVIEK